MNSKLFSLMVLMLAAIALIMFSPSCSTDISRDSAGATVLTGSGGELPGRVVTPVSTVN